MANKKIFVITMPRSGSTYLYNTYVQYNSPEQYDVIHTNPWDHNKDAAARQQQMFNIYNSKRCVVVSHATDYQALTPPQTKFLFRDCATHFTLLFPRDLTQAVMSLIRARTVDLWHTIAGNQQTMPASSVATDEVIDDTFKTIATTLHFITYQYEMLHNANFDNIIFKEDLTYDPKIDWFNSGYCDIPLDKLHIRRAIFEKNPPVKDFLINYDSVYNQVSDYYRSYENKNIEIKDGIVKHLFGKT